MSNVNFAMTKTSAAHRTAITERALLKAASRFSADEISTHDFARGHIVPSFTAGEIAKAEWEAYQADSRAMHKGAVAAVAMAGHRLHIVCYPLEVPVWTKRIGARKDVRFVGLVA